MGFRYGSRFMKIIYNIFVSDRNTVGCDIRKSKVDKKGKE